MDYNYLNNLFNDGNFSDVVKCSVDLLDTDIDSSIRLKVYNILGLSYYNLNNFKDSIDTFNLALDIDKDSYVIHQNIGNCYLALKKYEKALISFNKSNLINPGSFITIYGKAKCYISLGISIEAIKFLESAILLNKNFLQCYIDLFNCYTSIKNNEAADLILDKAINNCDISDNDLNTLSNCYLLISNFDKSHELLLESIKLNPNNRLTYELLCDSYVRLNNIQSGIDYLNKLLLKDDKNSFIYFALSKLFYFINDKDQFLRFSKLGLDINNNDYIHYNLLGAYYLSLKMLKQSEKALLKSINLNPNFILSYVNLSNLYFASHDYEKCLDIVKKGLKLDKNNKNIVYIAGNLLKVSKNYKEAIKYLTKSKFEGWEESVLECLYFDNNINGFTDFLNKNLSSVSISRTVSSFCTHLTHNTGNTTHHKFCPNPYNYVKSFDLGNFDNLPNVNKRLLDEINKFEMGSRNQPLLVGGEQTILDIFSQNSTLLNNFKSFLFDQAKIYKEIFINEDDLFIKEWPNSLRINGWCVVMNSNGYLYPHNHPKGWLSGCYYIKVPDKKKLSEGNIEFSLSNSNFPAEQDKIDTLQIETKESRLILFPSSLYHKTLSFSDNTERVCIAFDFEPNNVI